ncbi:MAG: MATE family efflux transporter [Methanomassiliicoccaceae archaeon]|nr:MATE family efflux transporter [Methanomassiliicoccaceae archaeon]
MDWAGAVAEDEKTKEVETLLGDPKKAILAMAIPTTVALVAQAVNNLVDAAWVSGLGRDALAAVGLVFPVFFIIIGVSTGIGIGAASAISKRIGAENKAGADRTAAHAIILVLIGSVIMTILFVLFLEPILRVLGSGAEESTIRECINYGLPIVAFMGVFMVTGVLANILRAEGAAKRSMYVLILAAIINLVLDPFFIYDYGLGWGMTGAAMATVIAESIAMLAMLYWYFVKKDLYLRFRFRGFRFESEIIKDIFKVGIPAALQMTIISIVSIFMNLILLEAGGDDGVAIYSSDWRVLSILTIPLMGIAAGVVPVCAAAFGAKRYDKVKAAYVYALKISVLLMIAVCVITIIFASQMVFAFTYDPGTEYLRGGMAEFLRIAALFLPFMAMGMVAESMFQALGMGMKSLVSTLFRNLLMVPLCYVAMIATTGLTYIWWGATVSEVVASAIVVVWSFYVLRNIIKGFDRKTKPADA